MLILTLTQVRHLIVIRSNLISLSRGRHRASRYISISYKDACTQRYLSIGPELPFQGFRCLYWRDQACALSRRPIIVKLTSICSPKQLVDFEIPYVILGKPIACAISKGIVQLSGKSGHSERRTHFGETSEIVAQKVRAALDSGLKIILCIGETLKEREDGKTTQVVEVQLQAVIKVTKESDWRWVKRDTVTDSTLIFEAISLLHTNQCGLLAPAKSPLLLKLRKPMSTSEPI